MQNWNQITIVDVTELLQGVVNNPTGDTVIQLIAEQDNNGQIVYYTVQPGASVPAVWLNCVLFPRGTAEVTDTLVFNKKKRPVGALNSKTKALYLQAGEDLQGTLQQNFDNFRLEGDLVSGADCYAVTIYQVQSPDAPTGPYIVLYVQGGGGNPGGGGVGHP